MSIQSPSKGGSITPSRLYELYQAGKTVDLIDVRTPSEYRSAHVPFARSQPLDSLDPQAVSAARGCCEEPLYVICQAGSRSAKACAAFAAAGHGEMVVNVEGGTAAWEKAGLPLERGRFVLPLDRQVRIAIGFLVLLGTVLGYLVNPVFYGLSAFCGAGLIFAGITDICMLANLIGKLPWNQTSGGSPSCQK